VERKKTKKVIDSPKKRVQRKVLRGKGNVMLPTGKREQAFSSLTADIIGVYLSWPLREERGREKVSRNLQKNHGRSVVEKREKRFKGKGTTGDRLRKFTRENESSTEKKSIGQKREPYTWNELSWGTKPRTGAGTPPIQRDKKGEKSFQGGGTKRSRYWHIQMRAGGGEERYLRRTDYSRLLGPRHCPLTSKPNISKENFFNRGSSRQKTVEKS